MRNLIAAGVRVAVKFVITALLSWLASFGIDITPEVAGQLTQALDAFLFAVAFGAVTVAMNGLEAKFPVLAPVFSLWTAKTGPDYVT